MTSSKWWKEKAVNAILYPVKISFRMKENFSGKQKLRINSFPADLYCKKFEVLQTERIYQTAAWIYKKMKSAGKAWISKFFLIFNCSKNCLKQN